MEAGRRWCVVWFLLLAVSLPGAERLRLETEDGLALEFSPEGLIDGVTIDGGPLCPRRLSCGRSSDGARPRATYP